MPGARVFIVFFGAAAVAAAIGCEKNRGDVRTPADMAETSLLSPGEGKVEEKAPTHVEAGGELGASAATAEEPPPPPVEDASSKTAEKARVYTSEGIALLVAGNFDAAAAKFKEALEENPKEYVAAFNLGVMAERRGDLAQARKYYKQSFEARPDYGPAVAAYAKLEQRTSGRKVALDFIEPRALKYKDSPDIQNAYASLLLEDGRIAKAMEVAKEVLKKDERNVGAMVALARAYLRNGQDEFARFIIGQAKEIDAQNCEVYEVLAAVALAGGNKKMAMSHLRKAVELNPYLVDVRNNLAVMLLEGANFQEAADQLEAAASLAPTRPEIFVNLGEAYRGLRRWKEAIDAFDKALRLGAPKGPVYFNLGLLYFSADSIEGMTRKEILLKAQSYFLKFRDEAGLKVASGEIDLDLVLKQIDKMIKIQEKLEARRKAAESGDADSGEGGG